MAKARCCKKMGGDDWQKFAGLRAYYAFMWGYPGKKLLFMGQEWAPWEEWSEARSLDWHLAAITSRITACSRLIGDLNHAYREHPGTPCARLRRRGLRMADRRRYREFGLRLAAPIGRRRSAGRRRQQFHAGAAPRLHAALAAGRALARSGQ